MPQFKRAASRVLFKGGGRDIRRVRSREWCRCAPGGMEEEVGQPQARAPRPCALPAYHASFPVVSSRGMPQYGTWALHMGVWWTRWCDSVCAIVMPPPSAPHQPTRSDGGDAACLAPVCFATDWSGHRCALLAHDSRTADLCMRCGGCDTPRQRCLTACAHSARTSASWGPFQSDAVVGGGGSLSSSSTSVGITAGGRLGGLLACAATGGSLP